MDIGGCSSVLQGMQQDECPMDDNGHQMDIGEDDGDPMDDGDYAYDSWKDKRMEQDKAAGYTSHQDARAAEREEPELDRQTNYDAPDWRDGDDSFDEGEGQGVNSPGYKKYLDDLRRDNEDKAKAASDNIWRSVDPVGYAQAQRDKRNKADEDIGNDEHMDTIPPESGVATPVGMTNLAGEPTMDEDQGGDVGGPGATAMGGMGTGSPYVGDMAMDADPELENMMMSRELGEASIHMFRNETDESLSALVEVLGLTEMNDWDDDPGQITLEVYEEATDSYKDVNLDVSWQIEPTEYDGQFISYQGSASVDGIQLDKPVQVNGKVYHKMDEELAALILATQGQGHTSLSDYITDTYADKIDLPQHKYPDSTR
jgi:hypothetical protein